MMQSNIFELIDTLVEMSGSKSNLDELKADLNETERRIQKTEKKLSSFEDEMNDDKYFDASSEIVDRNIKISLVKKLQDYNKIKNDIETELNNVKGDEVVLHDELDEVREEISSANKYNSIIKDNDSESKAYNDMIEAENSRIAYLVDKKDKLEEKYDGVQKKVEYLALSLEEIEEKIKKETERLNEIENNLSNIRAYIDVDAKEADEKKYIEIKDQLDSLISHKDEILNDPVYIAGNIKELVTDEDKDKVEEEFNRLVDIIRDIPYMDLENEEIQKEKDKLDQELKDYDTEISQKEYQTLDKEFIEERISYLDENIKSLNSKIAEFNSMITKLNNENDAISSKIYSSEVQIRNINDSLIDYETYDYESNNIPKSVVQASNNKLIEERENISEIASRYREDLVNNIASLDLIKELLETKQKEVSEKESELDTLNKKLALNTKSVNVLEEEKDKVRLEKINNDIIDLKNREKFTKSLSSILEEFEMLNSSLEFVDKKTRTQRYSAPVEEKEIVEAEEEPKVQENISEETNDTSVEVQNEEAPVIDQEEIKNETIEENQMPVLDEQTNNQNSVFPFMVENEKVEEPKEEKLRVVEIIPISDNLTESNEQDFMVNDFQDDDYVDLDTALTSMEGN